MGEYYYSCLSVSGPLKARQRFYLNEIAPNENTPHDCWSWKQNRFVQIFSRFSYSKSRPDFYSTHRKNSYIHLGKLSSRYPNLEFEIFVENSSTRQYWVEDKYNRQRKVNLDTVFWARKIIDFGAYDWPLTDIALGDHSGDPEIKAHLLGKRNHNHEAWAIAAYKYKDEARFPCWLFKRDEIVSKAIELVNGGWPFDFEDWEDEDPKRALFIRSLGLKYLENRQALTGDMLKELVMSPDKDIRVSAISLIAKYRTDDETKRLVRR